MTSGGTALVRQVSAPETFSAHQSAILETWQDWL